MSDGTFWEPGDAGSAYGYRQRVAPSGTYDRIQAARAAFTEHLERCDECGFDRDALCEAGRQLEKAHREVENPAPIPGGAVGFLANRTQPRQHDTPGETQ